jgi:hypothetical protein
MCRSRLIGVWDCQNARSASSACWKVVTQKLRRSRNIISARASRISWTEPTPLDVPIQTICATGTVPQSLRLVIGLVSAASIRRRRTIWELVFAKAEARKAGGCSEASGAQPAGVRTPSRASGGVEFASGKTGPGSGESPGIGRDSTCQSTVPAMAKRHPPKQSHRPHELRAAHEGQGLLPSMLRPEFMWAPAL